MNGAPYNPYSALSRLCYKHKCSPNDTQRVLEILADEISRCEVIGNIHENPELLGEEE